jgi:cobalt ECF transporter T component CbiQ
VGGEPTGGPAAIVSFHHLDQYATVPSPITAAPPVARLLGAAAVAAGAATLPHGAWGPLAVLAMPVLATAAIARLPLTRLLARMAGPLAFVLLASIGLLVLVPGEPAAQVGPVAVTREGIARFGFVVGRAIVALGAAVVLVSTTSFPDLLHALRTLRLPLVVTTALGLAYRLLYLLVDELERLQRAARSRNAGRGEAGRRRLLVGVSAAVLGRAYARAERTHRAMVARGYRGDLPSLQAWVWSPQAVLALAALVALVAATSAAAHLGAL